jgi:hypothetical protein
MITDFSGQMMQFPNVKLGTFFVSFDDDDHPILAMKTSGDVSGESDGAVLVFTLAVHPSMTPPTILRSDIFRNRDVLVLAEAAIRPMFQLSKLRRGSPSVNFPGPIIIDAQGVFIRAWAGSGTVDVDVKSGAIASSLTHPGSTWVDDWKIVLREQNGESVLCHRGRPKASAQPQAAAS